MNKLLQVALAAALIPVLACDRGGGGIGGSGFIEATSVTISSETSGTLEALYVGEGDAVTQGTVIGVIDSSTVTLQLEKAAALRKSAVTAARIAEINIEQAVEDVALAKKEFDRVASLKQKGSANQQQYDQAENRFKQGGLARRQAQAAYEARQADLMQIDAEVALLRRQLRNCYPSSPISGVVVDKLAERGELLTYGKPILQIAKTDTVWVKVYLPAGDLTAVSIGAAASVDPEDGRDKPLQGRVVWISDQAEFTPKNVQTAQARADLVYAVKVNVSNPRGELKIGMPVMVRF